MPLISKIDGIEIIMYFNEHNPPHFHVRYGNEKALISIETGDILEGLLSEKVLRAIKSWHKKNKEKLIDNWNNIANEGTYNKID